MPGPPLADTLKRRCAPPHGPARKAHERKGREADPTAEEGRAFEGMRPGGYRSRSGFGPPLTRIPGESKPLQPSRSRESAVGERQERNGLERGTALREDQDPEGPGKSQERYRGAINPEGRGGRKPARACETPRSERGGCLAGPAPYGSLRLQALKGDESPGGLSASGVRTGAAKVASVGRRAGGRPPARSPEGAREPMRGAAGGFARTPCKRCNTPAARRRQEDRGAVETARRERRSQ